MNRGLTAKIPLERISRAEIYINSKRMSMGDVQKELGCDYLINASLFHGNFKAASYLVKNYKTLCGLCDPRGYSLNGHVIIYNYANNMQAPDFVGGYPALIANKKDLHSAVPAGLAGDRGRSAMGITADSLILRCVPDTIGDRDFTLAELTADMLNLGCESAINFDGGGSSQCFFAGQRITSSRLVYSYLAVWLKKDGGKTMKVLCNKKTRVYNAFGNLEPRRYIDKGDKCELGALTDSLTVEITYPVAGGARSAWIKDLANFRQG